MKLIVDTLAVEYRDEGKGPLVLLLHGWGSDLSTFDNLVSNLKKNYRFVRVDLPGFGRSESPVGGWTVGDYAEFIERFINKLEIENIHGVIGHSFGGRIAIKGLANGDFKASKLILLASHGIKEPLSAKRMSYKAAAKIGKLVFTLPGLSIFAEPMRKKLYAAAGTEDYISAGSKRETFLKVIGEDLSSAAAKVAVPTLLIYGDQDQTTPVSIGRRFNELIPDSRLQIVNGAGHYVHNDKPLDTVRLLKEFL